MLGHVHVEQVNGLPRYPGSREFARRNGVDPPSSRSEGRYMNQKGMHGIGAKYIEVFTATWRGYVGGVFMT